MSDFREIWRRSWEGFNFAVAVQRLRAADAERSKREVEKVNENPQPSITCCLCGRTSYHPRDIEEGYCAACHWWTGRPDLLADWLEHKLNKAVAGDGEVPEGFPLHPALAEAIVHMLRRR